MRHTIRLLAVMCFLLVAVGVVPTRAQSEGQEVPPISFAIPASSYDPIRYEAALLLAREWEALGLTVNLNVLDFTALTQVLGSPPHDDYNAFVSGYVSRPERLDPDVLLYRPFSCEGVETGVNYQGYCSEEYESVVLEQRETMDPDARRELVYEAQEILARDLPAITLYHVREISAYNGALFENAVPMMGQGLWNVWNLLSITPKTDERILRTGQAADLDTANPFASTGGANIETLRLIYDMLARVRPDGSVEPWAAEGWEIIDDTTIQVTLRQGMFFHDGEPVTASDVKFSYDVQKERGAAIYQPFLEPISEIEIVDDYTLIFHLDHPYPALFQATFAQIYILPEHIWGSAEGALENIPVDTPIGSGPFKWGEWRPGESIYLIANPDHFNPPQIDGLIQVIYANPDAIFLGLVNGDIHMHDRRLLPTQIGELEQYDFLTRVEQDDFGVYYVGFNLRIPPFDDLVFRQAIAQTVDYDTIVNTLLDGYAVPGSGFIAPANAAWHAPGLEYPAYNPELARQTLADAGYTWDENGRLLFPAS